MISLLIWLTNTRLLGPSPSDNTKDEVGWDFYTRVMLERMLEMGRVIVVIAVVAGHIYMIHPPTTIYYGKKLHMGKSIGTCTLFHDLRNCKPFEMKLEKDQLIVIDKKDPEKPLWVSCRSICCNRKPHINRLDSGKEVHSSNR
jgi:hypothetical protein